MAKQQIKLATDQRRFIITYCDSIGSDKFDDIYEQMLFVVLKKYADSNGRCFPSTKTLARDAKMSRQCVIKKLDTLEQKGILKSEKRIRPDGGCTSNIYTLYDYAETWTSNDNVDKESVDDEREINRVINTWKAKGYTVTITKEKEPESTQPAKAVESDSNENLISNRNTKTSSVICQDVVISNQDKGNKRVSERYTMEEIRQNSEYDIMITDHPTLLDDVNAVMSVLYDVLNTRKNYIRIDGDNKPAEVVISRLTSLSREEILYAINKYKEQTDRIDNPRAYMTAVLYHAKEQYNLDIRNLTSYNRANG